VEVPPLGPENASTPPGGIFEPPPILAIGEVVTSVEILGSRGLDVLLPSEVPQGLSLRAITVQTDVAGAFDDLRLYYSPEPVDVTTTLSDVIAAGGMLLLEGTDDGMDAETVATEVDRAVIVKVGPHDAALIWGDPVHHGVRAYSLFWSDGERDFAVRSGFPTPEIAVSVAQSLYC
jgi:hypothetical protein